MCSDSLSDQHSNRMTDILNHRKQLLHWSILGSLLCAFVLGGCASSSSSREKNMSVETLDNLGVTHTISSGQTLERIARSYNVSLFDLMDANDISDPSDIHLGQDIFIPKVKKKLFVSPESYLTANEVKERVGTPAYTPWKTITIHHSATQGGNGTIFYQYHRQRKMGGLFYHFVIGNGLHAPDGEVETGWRWLEQVEAGRHNDIQICVVGNFNNQHITEKQLDSLIKLVDVLSEDYRIPPENIRGHRDIPGKHTDCPGHHFPINRIIEEARLAETSQETI